MPLFKRRQKQEEEKPEKKPAKEAAPEEEQEAAPEEEQEAAPEEEKEAAPEEEKEAAPEEGREATPEEEQAGEEVEEEGDEEEEDEEEEDEEEEDEDVPSIDELLEEASTSADTDHGPVELDEALGELAGEDVQVLKMARKVVVIGDPAVGKTSLIKRWVQDDFDDRYLNTIGAKVMKKEVGIKRSDTRELVDLKLILWDIAGQETFETVKKAYYRGASGAIVVCDVTRRETMENLHRWIENLFDVSDVIPMVIIINKIDLDSEFTFSEEEVIDEYAPYGAGVHLTSAKTGENVEMVFHELGKIISK